MSAAGKPGRRWGYHSVEPRAAGRIVAAAGIRPGDVVVDLGAGVGSLTAPLVTAGARVLAVELHPGRAARLAHRFGPAVLLRRDDLRTTALPGTPYRVVANPPWSTLETLRERLLRSPSLIRADLVVPRWVAHRWAARYPRITVGGSVPAEAFRPCARTGAAVAVILGRRRSPR
ncbi:23S rRNA (adenine(2058)-N(6))-methyltransferase Erm(37) [soil metagenome]